MQNNKKPYPQIKIHPPHVFSNGTTKHYKTIPPPQPPQLQNVHIKNVRPTHVSLVGGQPPKDPSNRQPQPPNVKSVQPLVCGQHPNDPLKDKSISRNVPSVCGQQKQINHINTRQPPNDNFTRSLVNGQLPIEHLKVPLVNGQQPDHLEQFVSLLRRLCSIIGSMNETNKSVTIAEQPKTAIFIQSTGDDHLKRNNGTHTFAEQRPKEFVFVNFDGNGTSSSSRTIQPQNVSLKGGQTIGVSGQNIAFGELRKPLVNNNPLEPIYSKTTTGSRYCQTIDAEMGLKVVYRCQECLFTFPTEDSCKAHICTDRGNYIF
jgi:hypothetical protein